MSLEEAILKKGLLLDGAMGTLLIHHLGKLKDLDEVSLLYPEEVERIHQAYSDAGANILKTNTFNNSSHTKKAVELAKRSIKKKNQFVAGVIGPVFKEVSLEKIVDDFCEGQVDVLLLETCMSLKDTEERIRLITSRSSTPLMVSMTLSRDGKAITGETAQSFFDAASQYKIFSFGFNCSFGPESITSAATNLKNPKNIPLTAHPNMQDNNVFFNEVRFWKETGLFHIIGGCCGTTPEDIKKLREIIPWDN